MQRYSKAIAALVGCICSILITRGLLPPELASEEVQAAIVTVITTACVYWAPANK